MSADWEVSFQNSQRPPVTVVEWHQNIEQIKQLFYVESRKLEDVRRIMAIEYGFYASKAAYKRKLDSKKNVSREKRLFILRIKQQREEEGKETWFYNFGQRISEEKIARWQREDLPTNPTLPVVLPSGISYCSPFLAVDANIQEGNDQIEAHSDVHSDHQVPNEIVSGNLSIPEVQLPVRSSTEATIGGVVDREASISSNHHLPYSPIPFDIDDGCVNPSVFETQAQRFTLQPRFLADSNMSSFYSTPLSQMGNLSTDCGGSEQPLAIRPHNAYSGGGINSKANPGWPMEIPKHHFAGGRQLLGYTSILGEIIPTAEEHALPTRPYPSPEVTASGSDILRGDELMEHFRYTDAIRCYEKALKQKSMYVPVNHENLFILDLYSRLGIASQNAGDYQTAYYWHQKAFEGRQNELGPDFYETLYTHRHIADALYGMGLFEDAISRYVMAAGSNTDTGGVVIHRGLCFRGIGMAYMKLGDILSSQKYLHRALKYFQPNAGAEHPFTQVTQTLLAVITAKLGSPEDAMKLCWPAVQGIYADLGWGHPVTASSSCRFATIQVMNGQTNAAYHSFREAAKVLEDTLGLQHPSTLGPALAETELLYALRRWDVPKLRDGYFAAFEGLRSRYGNDHPFTIRVRHNLGLAYALDGNHKEAFNALYEIRRAQFAGDAAFAITALKNFALVSLSIPDAKLTAANLYQEATVREQRPADWYSLDISQHSSSTLQFISSAPQMVDGDWQASLRWERVSQFLI